MLWIRLKHALSFSVERMKLDVQSCSYAIPDRKVLGPILGNPGSCRPQMGPMLAPWTLLWRISFCAKMTLTSIVSEVWPGLDNCSFNCCSFIVACLERVIRYEVVGTIAPYQEYISLYKAWIRVWYLGYDWDQNYFIATDYPNIWLGVLLWNHNRKQKQKTTNKQKNPKHS